MLPVVDKPVIQYVVEEAVAAGIEQIIIVSGTWKRAIEDHFDVHFELEARLRAADKAAELAEVRRLAEMAQFVFVRQSEPLGNGHAVLMARAAVGDEPFAVLWGDDIVDSEVPCLAQMLDAYERCGASVCAVMPVPEADVPRYGIIDGERVDSGLYRVRRLVEKPPRESAPSRLATVKEYVLDPEVFEVLASTPPGKGGEIWLADALNTLAARGRLYAAEFEGRRYDVGNKLEWLFANLDLALKRPDLGPGLRAYLREICATSGWR